MIPNFKRSQDNASVLGYSELYDIYYNMELDHGPLLIASKEIKVRTFEPQNILLYHISMVVHDVFTMAIAGGYVGAAVPGSARYFCTVLDESPRIYASAMALAIEGMFGIPVLKKLKDATEG